jgi:hypothetical protein
MAVSAGLYGCEMWMMKVAQRKLIKFSDMKILIYADEGEVLRQTQPTNKKWI